jgi:hypothetical protein
MKKIICIDEPESGKFDLADETGIIYHGERADLIANYLFLTVELAAKTGDEIQLCYMDGLRNKPFAKRSRL